MREQITQQIHDALGNRTSFFIREQDIQLYLARYFIHTGIYENVFIEYHIPGELIQQYPWTDINNIYIDIVLEINNRYYPVEIKYKTRKQETPHLIFGQNVPIELGQHGAQNIGCYDFWKDVKRIELFEQVFPQVERGITLFVSNDPSYKKPPLNPDTGYAQFSLHQGRDVLAHNFLNWNRNLSIADTRPGFSLNYDYHVNWNQMLIPQHFYLLT